jgi:histidyl-tRNA synthetase
MKKESKKILAPQPISGFPEWLPEVKILENRIMEIIRRNYELYGFVPIETSAVERSETLTSKGGNEKEIYSLSRLAAEEGESNTTEMALHFDLTVPLARYVAQNYGKITFPFRRYQMQKVWRGERPQAGRYREFYQCDIDVIGDGELSFRTDAEIPSVIYQIFKEMNIGKFVIRINNRKILQGLFQHFGIEGEKSIEVMRVVDKIEKIGAEKVCGEIKGIIDLSLAKISELINLINNNDGNEKILFMLRGMNVNNLFAQGVEELLTVFEAIKMLGVPDENLAIDLKIARGLDYYTGTVYETALVDYPSVGSICSGGRYDNLAGHFTEKKLPGVGISIGMSRLLSRLLDAGIIEAREATVAPVLITVLDQAHFQDYLKLATSIRNEGINVEVFLEIRSLKAQMKYANRKGFMFVIIAGETEFADGKFLIKKLLNGKQFTGSVEEIISVIKKK